ncbi:MAG TPA: carboxypeptidase-like regulatory domain-containing protein, partial [Puia sp.]|nr:carboxypeptidase-like regulatory domain-containing protein [Puia sp.]
MKNRLTLVAGILFAGLIVLAACQKYSDTDTNTGNNPPPDNTVTASLQGRVLDENGLPVKDAVVTSGGSNASTDVNGVFSFSNIPLSGRWGYVKVTRQGYFAGSRTIITNPGAVNFVEIVLLPRVAKGSFSAAAGGNIVVQAGNTVSFDGGSVVVASSNAPYTGNVNVFATWLDPSDPGLYKHMPGDLRGVRTTGKEVGLQSF